MIYAVPWWMLPFVWMGQAIVWATVWTVRCLAIATVSVTRWVADMLVDAWDCRSQTDFVIYEMEAPPARFHDWGPPRNYPYGQPPSEQPTEPLKWPGEK